MEMQSSRALSAPRALVWQALNDTQILQGCIAGCERLEQTEENKYAITVSAAVGPVKARFNGRLALADLDPPRGYRIEFEAQGAAAGFGKGLATVSLQEVDTVTTLLEYTVKVQVGGRLAQVGSRLVDAAAKKVAGEFFESFDRAVAGLQADAVSDRGRPITQQPAASPALRWLAVALSVAAVLALVAVWWLRG